MSLLENRLPRTFDVTVAARTPNPEAANVTLYDGPCVVLLYNVDIASLGWATLYDGPPLPATTDVIPTTRVLYSTYHQDEFSPYYLDFSIEGGLLVRHSLQLKGSNFADGSGTLRNVRAFVRVVPGP